MKDTVVNNFDFSDIEEALHQRHSSDYYGPTKTSLNYRAVIMPIEKLLEYTCYFLEKYDVPSFATNCEKGDIAAPVNCLGPDSLKQSAAGSWNRMRVRNSEEPLYDGGTIEWNSARYRNPQTHPMTFSEIRAASKVATDNPEIEQTFQVMRACIQSYGVELLRSINRYPQDKKRQQSIQTLLASIESFFKQANTNDFAHVLTLQAARSSGIEKAKSEGCPISGGHLAEGIKQVFARCRTFESYNTSAMADGRLPAKCPFGDVFGQLWNTRFDAQSDGSFIAKASLGGFFDTVMSITRSQQSLTFKPLSSVGPN